MYDEESRWGASVNSPTKELCKKNDTFRMSFNFNTNKAIFYHNGTEMHYVSIAKYNMIKPAFSFVTIGEEIEVTKYEFTSY